MVGPTLVYLNSIVIRLPARVFNLVNPAFNFVSIGSNDLFVSSVYMTGSIKLINSITSDA